MASHAVTIQVRPGSDAALSGSKTYDGTSDTRVSESIPAPSTNLEVFVGIDVSAVKSFYMKSSRDMTIESFNGAAAGQTLNLLAGYPYLWTTDSYDTFKFTADITKFQCDLAAGAAATLEILINADPTP